MRGAGTGLMTKGFHRPSCKITLVMIKDNDPDYGEIRAYAREAQFVCFCRTPVLITIKVYITLLVQVA